MFNSSHTADNLIVNTILQSSTVNKALPGQIEEIQNNEDAMTDENKNLLSNDSITLKSSFIFDNDNMTDKKC